MYEASEKGHVEILMSLLADNPDMDVNWTNVLDFNWTALHVAAFSGHVHIAKLLLAHPDINVNLKSSNGHTAFFKSSSGEHRAFTRLLLKDPRVDITLGDEGFTPLWHASRYGKHEVVEWLIASGRDLGEIGTALEIAEERNKPEAASLLERFLTNPVQTRHELRVKLGILDELAAEVFALTVFLCDDLLQLKPAALAPATTPTAAAAATRFFTIASKLPMELQMILCHRAVGSMKQNILHKDSEATFKSLARTLLLLSQLQ